MLTFPSLQLNYYNERYTLEDAPDEFIQKVAMSSNLLNKNTDVSFSHHHATQSPIVVAIYGETGSNLGFARLGDKVWTDVNIHCPRPYSDIVYHKGNFYVVDCHGDVYVCCIDDGKETGGLRGKKIASIKEVYHCDQIYLVEPLSGCGLLLLARYSKVKFSGEGLCLVSKSTTDFALWRLNLNYYDSLKFPSCTWTKVINLGNEAIFVGRASSLSVSSSEFIKPNSIYFTDDNTERYLWAGGGHDMGIFDLEHRTTEPHFQGKSLHCISPPLWYI